MRRIALCIVTLLLFSVTALAQKVMFQGVNICRDGTVVADALAKKGFKKVEPFDFYGNAQMKGTFLERKCCVDLRHDEDGKVCCVRVRFDKKYDYASDALLRELKSIRKRLEPKYGKMRPSQTWKNGYERDEEGIFVDAHVDGDLIEQKYYIEVNIAARRGDLLKAI